MSLQSPQLTVNCVSKNSWDPRAVYTCKVTSGTIAGILEKFREPSEFWKPRGGAQYSKQYERLHDQVAGKFASAENTEYSSQADGIVLRAYCSVQFSFRLSHKVPAKWPGK